MACIFRSVVLRFCLSLIATTAVVVAAAAGDDLLGNNSGDVKKQLVVFAGPHKTSETNVEAFYYKFARGDHPDFYKEEALRGWSWPQILGTYRRPLHVHATQRNAQYSGQ